MNIVHQLLNRHYRTSKDGVGSFAFCEPRVPFRKACVGFSPDFDGARWWPVPCVEYDSEDDTLLARMLSAGSAHQAMHLLREAYAEEGMDVA